MEFQEGLEMINILLWSLLAVLILMIIGAVWVFSVQSFSRNDYMMRDMLRRKKKKKKADDEYLPPEW